MYLHLHIYIHIYTLMYICTHKYNGVESQKQIPIHIQIHAYTCIYYSACCAGSLFQKAKSYIHTRCSYVYNYIYNYIYIYKKQSIRIIDLYKSIENKNNNKMIKPYNCKVLNTFYIYKYDLISH